MTGARGRKADGSVGDNKNDDLTKTPDGLQQASKKEVKRTQQMVIDLEDKIENLNGTLDNLTEKLQRADDKFSQHALRLAYLEAKSKRLAEGNKKRREHVDILENEKRILNLKIDGVKEEENENLSDCILRIATAIGVRCQPVDIKAVYRIGRCQDRRQDAVNPRARPILVQFKTEAVRDNIFFGRTKLKGNVEWKAVYINDDVNESTRKKREELRAVALLCKHKNVNHRLYSDAIVINNRKYTEHQLDILPTGLKLCDAKTIKTDKGLLFQSEHSFLTSFHEAPFEYNNHVHNTVEHGFNYERAVTGKRDDIAELILEVPTPQEAKRLGKLIPDSPEFNANKGQLMETLQYEKYTQNPHLKLKLVETGDIPLLEATVDEYFGIGRQLNAKLLQELTWTGSNNLGITLGKLRSSFVGE